MKPIVIPETNAVFIAEGCGDLPAVKCHDEDGNNYIVVAWEISPEELQKLQQTGIIYLSVMGVAIPPVNVTVERMVESDGRGDSRENGKHLG